MRKEKERVGGTRARGEHGGGGGGGYTSGPVSVIHQGVLVCCMLATSRANLQTPRFTAGSMPLTIIAPPLLQRRNGEPVEVDIRFRIMWGDSDLDSENKTDFQDFVEDDVDFQTPPEGLLPAGEGKDPQGVDVNFTTGYITATPRSNGNYIMYLIAVDESSPEVSVRLPFLGPSPPAPPPDPSFLFCFAKKGSFLCVHLYFDRERMCTLRVRVPVCRPCIHVSVCPSIRVQVVLGQ